ncbi:hypothetical protein [Dactylosporangium sp. CS-033363]|uniref:hypothetical protein n=1 Tax=Dactylosporangium sp. CS-033363 TaxID=3239935 RepID=UPI003D8D1346
MVSTVVNAAGNAVVNGVVSAVGRPDVSTVVNAAGNAVVSGVVSGVVSAGGGRGGFVEARAVVAGAEGLLAGAGQDDAADRVVEA